MARAQGLPRRDFLSYTLGVGAAASWLPASSWARAAGANERVTIGSIGCGGMGTSHLHNYTERAAADNCQVSRVCDVYRRRLNNAIGVIGGTESSGTMEYREVLDDKSVDAIVIATPDHWHTKIAIEGLEAGKAVFVEKPLALTVEQAIECRNAVRRTGGVLAVGPQRTSDDLFHKAREAIASNRIGKVTWSQGAYCRNSREGQFNWTIDADASPTAQGDGHVWWDRWLGHEWGLAEKIGWNPDHFFRFRKYFAYNGGVATDLLYHLLAPLLLAIEGPNGAYPSRVAASGGRYVEKDARDIPDQFFMSVDYPGEHTVVLSSVMTNDDTWPTVIRGQWGSMEVGDTLRLREQGVWSEEFRRANKDRLSSPGEPGTATLEITRGDSRDHNGNFLASVRGEAKPSCNVELGCATMVAIKLAVESYRQNKVMMWDGASERAYAG